MEHEKLLRRNTHKASSKGKIPFEATKVMFVCIIMALFVFWGCEKGLRSFRDKSLNSLAEECAHKAVPQYVSQHHVRGCPISETIEFMSYRCQEQSSTRGVCYMEVTTSANCGFAAALDFTLEIHLEKGESVCHMNVTNDSFLEKFYQNKLR